MKTINKYVDEISGREFNTEKQAEASEKKSKGIKDIFAFWNRHKKGSDCSFENGGWAYQRTQAEVFQLMDGIILAVKLYEPYVYKQYEGKLSREHLNAGYMIGRYLGDGDSDIYSYVCLLSCICMKCFRQHGQPYHANNCKHDMKVKPLK